MDILKESIDILAKILVTLIFARVLLSWLAPHSRGGIVRFVYDATEPLLKPIRRALPRFGALDLSPIIAFFLIEMVRSIIFTWL